jgi:hypothetical protein
VAALAASRLQRPGAVPASPAAAARDEPAGPAGEGS